MSKPHLDRTKMLQQRGLVIPFLFQQKEKKINAEGRSASHPFFRLELDTQHICSTMSVQRSSAAGKTVNSIQKIIKAQHFLKLAWI